MMIIIITIIYYYYHYYYYMCDYFRIILILTEPASLRNNAVPVSKTQLSLGLQTAASQASRSLQKPKTDPPKRSKKTEKSNNNHYLDDFR